MNKLLIQIERLVDRLLFPALLILLVIIVLELFFHKMVAPYQHVVDIIDSAIIIIFVIDLGFKFHRARTIKGFLREHWLEIIAVIPFFLVFRVVEGLGQIFGVLGETTKEGQQVVHVGTEFVREAREVKFGQQAYRVGEALEKEGRLVRFTRFMRPASRLPRFLKLKPEEYQQEAKKLAKDNKEALHFFEEPNKGIFRWFPQWHEKKKKRKYG
ncbi:ion transporter [Candidatus Woesearchaeota archaeon]|nr:ion transporter [Candidatus Woesearchaeota archaeon]